MDPLQPEWLINCLPFGIVILDHSGNVTYLNPAAEKLTESTLEKSRGKHWTKVFQVTAENPDKDRTGSLVDILHEQPLLISSSGTSIPIEFSISTVENDEGTTTGSMLILRDVADQNKERDGLRESRAKYKRLVNSIEGVVWEADGEDLTYTYVSAFAQQLLGYPSKSWMSEKDFWKTIIHPEDREFVFDAVSEALEKKKNYQVEYRVVASDGRILWVRDSVTVRIEEGLRLSGVLSDVTAARLAQESLMKSEERFSSAFYSNPGAIAVISPAGKILDVNESFERMTGYFRNELLERTPVDSKFCSAEDYETLMATLRQRGRARDEKLVWRTKTGEARYISASFDTVTLSGLPCFLGMFQDVTDLKNAEQMKKELISIMRQELTSPIRSVQQSLAHVLSSTELRGKERNTLSSMGEVCSRMIRFLDDLLDAKKP